MAQHGTITVSIVCALQGAWGSIQLECSVNVHQAKMLSFVEATYNLQLL